MRYRALDIVRNRAREIGGHEPAEEVDEAPDAFAVLLQSAEGAALQRCLSDLDPERRRIILLAYVDGLSHGELSARLRLPLGTVKSWIRRGLRALRGCLDA